jgi:hypothetical protein
MYYMHGSAERRARYSQSEVVLYNQTDVVMYGVS